MSRFVLVDNSIVDLAGHHYEYAMHVLEAAEKGGYKPILVTNRSFRGLEGVKWPVLPIYEFGFWPEAANPWYVRTAAAMLERLRPWWLRVRCRARYSMLGVAWAGRCQILSYLGVRNGQGRSAVWIAGLGLIAVTKAVRSVAVAAMIPVAAAGVIVFLTGCLLLGAVRLCWSATARYSGAIPDPARRYLRLLANEPFTYVQFASALLSKVFKLDAKSAHVRRQEARQSAAFARDTGRMLEQVGPRSGDVFFFPTIAPRDLLALQHGAERHPGALDANWHCLFRRNIYQGREGDYLSQEPSLEGVRIVFRRFSRSAIARQSFFYTDTAELSEQYNRLCEVRFHTLPIPHTHAPEHCMPHGGPLRLTYLGDARSEKGFHFLPRVAAAIRNDYLKTGKAQIVAQCNFNIPGGEPAAAIARAQLGHFPENEVQLHKEALSSEQYRTLLLSADVNLLFYDPINYFARSSGILVESLAAGIPVIVPSGCWLSAQFLDAYVQHVESLGESLNVVASGSVAPIVWRDHPHPGTRDAFSSLEVPAGANYVLIRVEFDSEVQHGHAYIRGASRQSRTPEETKSCWMQAPANLRRWVGLRQLTPDLDRIDVAFGTAHKNEWLSIARVRVDFIHSPETVALGSVGLIYDSVDEIPSLVSNMIDHYPHFRRTAQEFARSWRAYHNPDRLVAEMQRVAGRKPATALQSKTAPAAGSVS